MTQFIDPHNAELAELCDLDYGDFADDLPLYDSLAQQSGDPILELGVGTGRVALQLARNGHEVWGIENSNAMLERARWKAGGAANPRFIAADMRDFDLGRTFALIYAGYGAFHHLLTPADQLACLRAAERHMEPDGVLVFDLRAIFATDWEEGDSVPLLHDWTRVNPDGSVVTKLRSIRVDRAHQTQHETYYYDRVAADGGLRRVSTNVDLRFSTRYEIEALLRETGLELDGFFGDFDLSVYDSESDLMITVARKRATG